MLKLATVFSGIGAIEHALCRMNINHKIVFACDNGDVDILSKKIDVDILKIKREFDNLNTLISRINISDNNRIKTKDISDELNNINNIFNQLVNKYIELDNEYLNVIQRILEKILELQNLKKARIKEYNLFIKQLNLSTNNDYTMLLIFQISIKLLNDFKKDNNMQSLDNNCNDFKSRDNINWLMVRDELIMVQKKLDLLDGKNFIKNIKEISERLGMIHEKIKVIIIKNELRHIKTFEERKKYIDSLYMKENNKNKVKKSYLANYQLDEKDFHWNISFLEGSHYKNKVDLFVGGSPCQSFSLVGKQRGLEDTRGTLFYEYARLVDEIRPKVFIYENVKAVLSNDSGNTWEIMKKVFTDLNYEWTYSILNSKNFGIPQNRERLFVVGFRKDLKVKNSFTMPKPISLRGLKLRDFLTENVSGKYYLQKKGVDFITSEKNIKKRYTQIDGDIQLCQKKNQQYNWHGDFVFVEEKNNLKDTIKDLEKYFLSEKVKKYVMASGTKGFYSKPKVDLDIARPLLTTMHKMHRAGVDNYVTTEGRLRKLTPRECLRLMGFCDSYKIVVSDTSQYQQAGNSIVVDVLIAIMKEIIKTYPNIVE